MVEVWIRNPVTEVRFLYSAISKTDKALKKLKEDKTMRANEVADIVNRFDIDWCYTCADPVIKNPKQKMFAWIVLNLMRMLGHQNYKAISGIGADNHLKLTISLEQLEENNAVKKYLYKRSFWKFLKHLIDVQLDNWDIADFEVSNKISFDKNLKELHIMIVRKSSGFSAN